MIKNLEQFKINPKTAHKLLKVFLYADLQYQLAGIPHHVTLEQQAKRHLGWARTCIKRVAALGPDAKIWMDMFIKEMSSDNLQ